MMIQTCSYATPVGDLTVLATGMNAERDTDAGSAVVIAAGFCSAEELRDRLPESEQQALDPVDDLGSLHQLIERYLDGDLSSIDQLPLSQRGTELQQQVWNGLRAIPAGETRTYSELAQATSKPKAVRAVGSACGRNLIAPFVPCHRALRSDGSLGGYFYGLDVKRWLLDHESAASRQSAPDLAG